MHSLRAVFDKYGTDKGMRHGYEQVYEQLAPPGRMLEVGVFRGASVRAWLEWWPMAEIHGMDTFERGITVKVPGAVIWQGDSTVAPPGDLVNLDLIIDDGDHTPGAQLATFRNLIPLLKKGGRYFIEDVWPLDRMNLRQRRHRWLRNHAEQFTGPIYAELLEALEAYDVIHHDLRAEHHSDSYIIEVRK